MRETPNTDTSGTNNFNILAEWMKFEFPNSFEQMNVKLIENFDWWWA